MTVFFILLEGLEIHKGGAADYFNDLWNVADWLNFCLFFVTYSYLFQMDNTTYVRSELCVTVGYCDDWNMMLLIRNAKQFLSFCICIQLLKIIKFTDTLVPKMNLATSVLRSAGLDLLFFAFVFIMSMLAFSMMFYVQLGPVMGSFNTQTGSLISLARALFGDFDIDDILNNSRDYLNAIFFLVYLFVAVFILLSMFLTILGEHQGMVRENEKDMKRDGIAPRELGVIDDCGESITNAFNWVRKAIFGKQAMIGDVSAEGNAEGKRGDAEGDGEEGDGKGGKRRVSAPDLAKSDVAALRHDVALLSAQVRELVEADISGRRLEAALATALESRLLPLISRAIDSRLAGGVPSAVLTSHANGNGNGFSEKTLRQQAALGSAGAAFLALTSEERRKRRGDRRTTTANGGDGGPKEGSVNGDKV